MNDNGGSFLLRAYKDERGQVLPWMVLMIVMFLGMAGLTLDLGHAYVCYRELQASTDAAALAGAYAMTLSGATQATVQAEVNAFSSTTGGANATPNLPNVPTPTVTLTCVTDSSLVPAPCTASATGKNVIRVVQTVSIPTIFMSALSAFGIKAATSLNLGTEADATLQAGKSTQVNVALVMDTTASMGDQDSDSNCNNTRIYCAEQGAQTLLQNLQPCTTGSTSSKCNAPYDQVSLFTFPNVEASTASKDTSCPSGNPTIVPYTTPTAGASWTAPTGSSGTYQIANYSDDYSSTNQQGGSLNSSSGLAIANGASGVSKCSGMGTPGGDGTYYAGAIYAAQSSLMAAQAANPGSQNVMIILSDGDASSSDICATWDTKTPTKCDSYAKNSSGNTVVYGAANNQCQQGIAAANFATGQGTQVVTIAYGAASSGCSTDTSGTLKNLSPCTAMQDMASSSADFYSDATASQNKGQCDSANSYTLKQIFANVAQKFSSARLLPNGIT
ncbi:MAG TPA: pilus assembly protein TadG-related protein [Terracidiphilus sp.]|nr:pilus assembly protein TadG-related protein [Terracidiphilus sp.]